MYCEIPLYDMAQTFQEHSTAFQRVVKHLGTALAIGYFKALEVERPKRGYTNLLDVYDPRNKEYLADIYIRLDELVITGKNDSGVNYQESIARPISMDLYILKN